MNQDGEFMSDVTITGNKQLVCTAIHADTLEILYDRPTMNWHLTVNGKDKLVTRTFLGQINIEKFTDNPIRIFMKDVDLIYSWVGTLLNWPLELKQP